MYIDIFIPEPLAQKKNSIFGFHLMKPVPLLKPASMKASLNILYLFFDKVQVAAGWCGHSSIEASEAIDIRHETCGFG